MFHSADLIDTKLDLIETKLQILFYFRQCHWWIAVPIEGSFDIFDSFPISMLEVDFCPISTILNFLYSLKQGKIKKIETKPLELKFSKVQRNVSFGEKIKSTIGKLQVIVLSCCWVEDIPGVFHNKIVFDFLIGIMANMLPKFPYFIKEHFSWNLSKMKKK